MNRETLKEKNVPDAIIDAIVDPVTGEMMMNPIVLFVGEGEDAIVVTRDENAPDVKEKYSHIPRYKDLILGNITEIIKMDLIEGNKELRTLFDEISGQITRELEDVTTSEIIKTSRLTPDGHSYDQKDTIEKLTKDQKLTDPKSRRECDLKEIIPNYNVTNLARYANKFYIEENLDSPLELIKYNTMDDLNKAKVEVQNEKVVVEEPNLPQPEAVQEVQNEEVIPENNQAMVITRDMLLERGFPPSVVEAVVDPVTHKLMTDPIVLKTNDNVFIVREKSEANVQEDDNNKTYTVQKISKLT